MVTIQIADHEESYTDDKTKDATCRTVDEFRETRLIESFVQTHKKSPFSVDFIRLKPFVMNRECNGRANSVYPDPYIPRNLCDIGLLNLIVSPPLRHDS
jgi:hypothetical protein